VLSCYNLCIHFTGHSSRHSFYEFIEPNCSKFVEIIGWSSLLVVCFTLRTYCSTSTAERRWCRRTSRNLYTYWPCVKVIVKVGHRSEKWIFHVQLGTQQLHVLLACSDIETVVRKEYTVATRLSSVGLKYYVKLCMHHYWLSVTAVFV